MCLFRKQNPTKRASKIRNLVILFVLSAILAVLFVCTNVYVWNVLTMCDPFSLLIILFVNLSLVCFVLFYFHFVIFLGKPMRKNARALLKKLLFCLFGCIVGLVWAPLRCFTESSGGGGPGRTTTTTTAFCDICNKTFSRFWSLQRHLSDTHYYTPQNLQCDVCGRSYRSRNSLVSHRSQYHREGNDVKFDNDC